MSEKKRPYAPNLRNYLDQDPSVIKSYSQKDYVILPDPITDPIVSNNIASQEFDYTYNDEDDFPEDY